MRKGARVTNKVTFGDDHSEGSDAAWGWIVSQSWPDWVLDIITIEEDGSPTEDSPMGYDALREYQPPTPRMMPEGCDFRAVHYLTAHHDPRVVLGSCPDSTLLVVGPRGKGLLKALHIGSTTEWLMRCPSTPLVIARQAARVRMIVACIDGSAHSLAAVRLLASLPWIAGCTVTVVGVVEEENDIRDRVSEAASILAEAGAIATALMVEPDPLALTTNPRTSILEVVDRDQPDLIVMGTRGMTGLPRLRVGSVASAVAHHVTCSVLLVRDTHADAE
jgi:nucleotide-binding universal stress UspA family protein